ncbi:MAG: hypothetical protein M1355_00855 [Patescibacteria group bacterium]|nr:hypothetical protein [Patescibacteria group bacterium]MCL5093674.1 hypothetical protein [Patescibacteria group bacterium]
MADEKNQTPEGTPEEKTPETKAPEQPAPEQPTPAPQPQQPAQPAPQKKSSCVPVLLIILIILVLGIGGLIVGGGYLVRRFVNKQADDIKSGNLNFNIGGASVQTGENAKWPDDLTIIAKFSRGKIKSAVKWGDVWTIIVSDVTPSDIANYKNTLQQQGWIFTEDSTTDAGFVQTQTGKKGDYQITLAYTPSDKSLLLTVNKTPTESTPTE